MKVKLGPHANSFSDQSMGIFIGKGDIKELTLAQANSPRIQRAINSGHLAMVVGEDKNYPKYSAKDIEKLTKKLEAQFKAGKEVTKVAKNYSQEEIQLVAKSLGFEVDPEDTNETLIQAIFDEFKGDNNE